FVSMELQEIRLHHVDDRLDLIGRRIHEQGDDVDKSRRGGAQFAGSGGRDGAFAVRIKHQSDGVGACPDRYMYLVDLRQSANLDSNSLLQNKIPLSVTYDHRKAAAGSLASSLP